MERFPGTPTPTTNFPAVRSDLQTTPLYVDIDLTQARSLAAGTAADIPLNGNVLYCDQKSASGFATLHFNDDARAGNTPFTVFPGFVARIPYTKILLENLAQPGMTLRLIYGVDLDFTPAVSGGVFGEVSVVDGAKSRTSAGEAFMAWASAGPVAANYAHVQVRNNHTDRNLFIERFSVSSGVATAFNLGLSPFILATNLRPAESKRASAAADTNVQARMEQLGALTTTQRLMQSKLVINQPFIYEFTEPVMLPPNTSIFAASDVVNADMYLNVEYFRETA